MSPSGEEFLEFEVRDFEEDVVDVSLSEPLDETVHEFDGPAACFANSTAAARSVSLKSARSRLPHLYSKLDNIRYAGNESRTQIHETCTYPDGTGCHRYRSILIGSLNARITAPMRITVRQRV